MEGTIQGIVGTQVTLGKRRGTQAGVWKVKRAAYALHRDTKMMVTSTPTIHDQQGQRIGIGMTLIIGASRSPYTVRIECRVT